MIDPRILREQPERVREAIARKHSSCDLDAVLEADAVWKTAVGEVERLRAEQKAANTDMAALPKGSPEFLARVGAMKGLSASLKEKETVLKDLEARRHQLLLSVPNLPHPSVPVGRTPEENVVHATWGDPASLVSREARPHYDIPWFKQVFDFERGVKVTGAGFPFALGDGAKLVRGLINFFLDEAGRAGYQEVACPVFVNEASATATGQLPDKEGQMYAMPADGLYAVPTAEVPLTNFLRDEILDETVLPVKRASYTPCFRREAGSWGKDVRGLNRLHQFDKVELVKWVHPSTSYDELEALRGDAESLLRKLELPYRVLLMCTGDLGFTQTKKYDLEVWSGGQKRWLEVSSCSNFESFQAMRAGIRFRGREGAKPEFVHTLNGSGLALPRVMAALLENGLSADGRVRLPAALVPYVGRETIGPS
jgi:seryl-tRNA synthetase